MDLGLIYATKGGAVIMHRSAVSITLLTKDISFL